VIVSIIYTCYGFLDTVVQEERKRVTRRKKEQRKKIKKRKKEVGKKQAVKLVLTTHGQEAADDLRDGKNEASKLSVSKLGAIPLLPRFHTAALRYLIDVNAVDDVKEASRLLDILITRKAVQSAAKPKKCQEQDSETDSPHEESEIDSEEIEDASDSINL
jgi:hypothetical protein